jgi:hypothetical protein
VPPAYVGAALGAILGVGAWALLASITDLWTGFCALPVGALAGAGSKRFKGRGFPAAAAATGIALAGMFAGQGFTARRQVEADIRGRLAAVDRRHYDAFAGAAADWNPKYRGDEVSKFAFRHEFVGFGGAGGVESRVAEFARTTVPVLEAWKRKPPAFEEWQAARREEILRGDSPWKAYLGSPMGFVSPLDLLCWLLGAAAAARLASVKAPVKIVRRGGR